MTFNIDDLPVDSAIWRSPDGWVVGEVYYDDHDQMYVFSESGRGPSIAAAQIDAREREEKRKTRLIEQAETWLHGPIIGTEPQTAEEHLKAAKLIIGAAR